ncbi:MAG: hypothetical protein M1820_006154 [Bogoriella megaspora]|nr:MAG: hypothetical protein M1820_006154 [Bogoriella megaspora]
MVSPILLLPVGLLIVYLISVYRSLVRNITTAKQSGIPYVVLPVYTFNRLWLLTHRLWLPLLKKTPGSSSWVGFLDPEFIWHERYDSFKSFNSDIFLLVTPGSNHLYVADAEVVSQIVTRRNDFPKPIEMYKSVDLFGKNVVSTEGSIWRHHRKITSPPFTEKNNYLVWKESLHQAQSMITNWVGKDGKGDRTIWTVAADTMRLSLHVISRAGFGVRLRWPHEEGVTEMSEGEGRNSAGIPPGHTLAYKDALGTLLENILWVMLMPSWLLKRSPFKIHKVAWESYVEWGKYMNEMYAAKRAEVRKGETTEGMDLMGALVRGAGFTADAPAKANGDTEKGTIQESMMLSDDEIIGNAFVFILAGHETAANTIHFSLLYLAMNPASRRRVQKDIDDILGDRPVDEWDYDNDCSRLFGSMVGAVMNEELRLIPPVIGIPKSTPTGHAQTLNFNGRKVVVPEGTKITLHTAATHRNPKYWPSGPPKPRIYSLDDISDESRLPISEPTLISSTYQGATVPLPPKPSTPHDEGSGDNSKEELNEFNPERWLLDLSKTADTAEVEDYTDIGGPQGRDTASSLLRPPRGAYIPFSEGYRACLGRRFAQVEVLAVLAVILKYYSVELAVDEYASDEEVAKMHVNGQERRRVWGKADSRARWLLEKGMMTIITIQMRKGKVPLRFVRRGNERFDFQ